MEKINPSYDEYVKNYRIPKPDYHVVYDPETLEIKGVYTKSALPDTSYALKIDNYLAEQMIDGTIGINRCRVDIKKKKLTIVEFKHLKTIDDLLHRVTDIKYANVDDIDIKITYYTDSKKLVVALAKYLGGTMDTSRTRQRRKISWTGMTEMPFIITAYNDPNIVLYSFDVAIDFLTKEEYVIENLDLEVNEFSLYTKRVFDYYVIEIL